MKILIASTPATGHLNPLLAIARILVAENHEIAFLTGTAFRARIEASSAKFFPLPKDADFDPQDILSVAPELKNIPPGPEWLRTACNRLFVDTIPAQNQNLNEVLKTFGLGPVTIPLFHSVIELADAYMQLSVPSFEFPREFPPTVHFVGTPPIIPCQVPLPPWAHELDGSRKVVLVTQGTVANHNF